MDQKLDSGLDQDVEKVENIKPGPETTDRLCARCDNDADLSFCDQCNVYLCKKDWKLWIHHRNNKSSGHIPVPRSSKELLDDWDASIFTEMDQTKHERLHEANNASFWFGMDAKEFKSLVNTILYTKIILSSDYHSHSTQFPSLVSFIGTTGAGKSTLGKALINLGTNKEERHYNSPIPGLKGVIKPTSSGVHLYYDPKTLHSEQPLLIADCEGLDGGNATPVASLMTNVYQIARKIVPWSKSPSDGGNEPEPLTREYCVNNIYPRILYAFSDIICFVIQQDARVIEKCGTQMILWADNVHEKSLNQAILPHVVVVLNKCDYDGMWMNEDFATAAILDRMAECTEFGPDLQKVADKWNQILPENEKVHSIKDLVLRYFRGVSAICVPLRARGVVEFHRQIQQLQASIVRTRDSINEARGRTGSRINAIDLEAYLNGALDHFFTTFDKPFDFSKYARANEQVSPGLTQNAMLLLREMNKVETNQTMLDKRAAKLFSSYLSMVIIPQEKPQVYTSLKNSPYFEQYRAAYSAFYENSQCWFRRCGVRCRNQKNGHAQGHQSASGAFLAPGDYQSPYTEQACQAFLDNLEYQCIASLNRLRGEASTDASAPIRQHSAALQDERQLLMELASQKICFFCLADSPDFKLDCQHNICSSCIKRFGRGKVGTCIYTLSQCPICQEAERDITFQLKPAEAGVRILTIDGGGVRGTVSARILQMLEDEIGLDLPIFHFFDYILGTNSGGIISLGVGVNRWSSENLVGKFKKLAKQAFKERQLAKLLVFDFLSNFFIPTLYEGRELELALKNAFGGPEETERLLLEETMLSSTRDSTGKLSSARYTDLKVGVTAVHATTGKTCIMSNYNRRQSKIAKRSADIYREDDRGMEIEVWQAARCTSTTPSIFPIYTTPNGHSFQDGGVNEKNPVSLAVKETQLAWCDSPSVDMVATIGSGCVDKEASNESGTSSILRPWIKKRTADFDKKCNAELQWAQYSDGLSAEQKERNHRLNVTLPGPIPDMWDTSCIENLDLETISFFRREQQFEELQHTARHALAVLFYCAVDGSHVSRDQFVVRFRILCRLDEEYQPKLMARLHISGCYFLVEREAVAIDFQYQQTRLMNGSSFEQPVALEVADPFQSIRIRLVFSDRVEDVYSGKVKDLIEDTSKMYDISGSPFHKSLLDTSGLAR
ncbi:hypothetical protein F5884DRAFT_859795 [Xylogone sp. PMI_703]|nr:hypothetical protein F5884DRAFT_859795 [Xylogone sp. PMI_703]